MVIKDLFGVVRAEQLLRIKEMCLGKGDKVLFDLYDGTAETFNLSPALRHLDGREIAAIDAKYVPERGAYLIVTVTSDVSD